MGNDENQEDMVLDQSMHCISPIGSPKIYDLLKKSGTRSQSPTKVEMSSSGLNARVVRNGNAGVTPRKFPSSPKIAVLRMNTSRDHKSIHSWIQQQQQHGYVIIHEPILTGK